MLTEIQDNNIEEFIAEANSIFEYAQISTLTEQILFNSDELIKWYKGVLQKISDCKNSLNKAYIIKSLNKILDFPHVYTNQKLCCALGRAAQEMRYKNNDKQEKGGVDDITEIYNSILKKIGNFQALHPKAFPLINANTTSCLLLSVTIKVIKFTITSITGLILYGPLLVCIDMAISLGAGYFASQSILSHWRQNRSSTQMPLHYLIGGYYTESFCGLQLAFKIEECSKEYGIIILPEDEANTNNKRENLSVLKMLEIRSSLLARYYHLIHERNILNKSKFIQEFSTKFASTKNELKWDNSLNDDQDKLVQYAAKKIFTPANFLNLYESCKSSTSKSLKNEISQIWYLVLNGFIDMPLENIYVLSELVSITTLPNYNSPLFVSQGKKKMFQEALTSKVPLMVINISFGIYNILLRMIGREKVIYDLSVSRFIKILQFAQEGMPTFNPETKVDLEIDILKQHSKALAGLEEGPAFLNKKYNEAVGRMIKIQQINSSPMKSSKLQMRLDKELSEEHTEQDKSMDRAFRGFLDSIWKQTISGFLNYFWKQEDSMSVEQFYLSIQTAITIGCALLTYAAAQTLVFIPIALWCAFSQVSVFNQKCGFSEKIKHSYVCAREYITSLKEMRTVG